MIRVFFFFSRFARFFFAIYFTVESNLFYFKTSLQYDFQNKKCRPKLSFLRSLYLTSKFVFFFRFVRLFFEICFTVWKQSIFHFNISTLIFKTILHYDVQYKKISTETFHPSIVIFDFKMKIRIFFTIFFYFTVENSLSFTLTLVH